MVQILSNTPAWVFGLFFALLVVGLLQTRTRSVGRAPAFLLPAGMIALSLAGIESSSGPGPIPLAAWALGLGMAAVVGYGVFRDERVAYDERGQKFHVPGSWMPLAVIMAIFSAKYAYAVMQALGAGIIAAPLFVAGMSAAYGSLSGYFAARALNLVRKAAIAGS